MNDEMIFDAIEFAVKAHAGQCRKGTDVPYIVHPLGVAKILIENGCSEKIVIAGILHDTIEDTSVTVEDIKQHFGKEVSSLVEGVSESNQSEMWETRKRHTIENLKTATTDCLLVEIADKLHNIMPIREDCAKVGESVFSRFNRPKESVRWYYQTSAEVFAGRIDGKPGASLVKQFTAEVQNVFGEEQV